MCWPNMKLSVYTTIVKYINSAEYTNSLASLNAKFPEISSNALASIFSQEYQKKVKRIHKLQYVPEKMDEYYYRYCEETQQHSHKHVILHLATKASLSPVLMARIILERHLMYTKYNGHPAPKAVVTQLLKDTSLLDDPLLALEIDTCAVVDDGYGPVVDTLRHSAGHECEVLLRMKLDELGMAYEDENQLRSKGYDKTPDFILRVPVAINGHVVNWIESKASFGDPESHDAYLKDQFWSYWNRFGSGLVIYWSGFVEELDVHRGKGIVLSDHLPEDIVFMNAAQF